MKGKKYNLGKKKKDARHCCLSYCLGTLRCPTPSQVEGPLSFITNFFPFCCNNSLGRRSGSLRMGGHEQRSKGLWPTCGCTLVRGHRSRALLHAQRLHTLLNGHVQFSCQCLLGSVVPHAAQHANRTWSRLHGPVYASQRRRLHHHLSRERLGIVWKLYFLTHSSVRAGCYVATATAAGCSDSTALSALECLRAASDNKYDYSAAPLPGGVLLRKRLKAVAGPASQAACEGTSACQALRTDAWPCRSARAVVPVLLHLRQSLSSCFAATVYLSRHSVAKAALQGMRPRTGTSM